MSLSSCDASPYAAAVNGHVLNQIALNDELKAWASNPLWVASFNTANSAQSTGAAAITVAGSGGPGTYSSTFVANILDGIIVSSAVHQHLVSTGNLPDQSMEEAARALYEVKSVGPTGTNYWTNFPAALRTALASRLADQATLAQPPADTSTLQQIFPQIRANTFSQICVDQASAFNAAGAQAIISGGAVNGSQVCYDQAGLEAQPAAYRTAVLKLTSGQISPPIPTSFGFQVVRLVSRAEPGFTVGVQRVLTLVTETAEPAALTQVIQKAKVKLNPAYGTWQSGQVVPPQITGS
jgi:hypothetical protein